MNVKHFPRGARTLFAVSLAAALIAGCGDKPEALVKSAKDYQAKKDHNAAVIQLRNALQQDSNNGEARYLLGMSLFETRDYPTAEKELRKAVELGYELDKSLPALARTMIELGQVDKLVSEFGTRKLSDAGAQADFQTSLGDALLAQRKMKEAQAAYAGALTASPGYPRARVGEARVVASENDLPGALRIVDEVLVAAPNSTDALFMRAELLWAQGKSAEAQQSFAKLIDLQPANHAARRSLIQMLINTGEFDKATAEIEAAKKAGGSSDVRLAYLEALLSLRQQKFDKAREQILQVLKVVPDHVPSLVVAGTADYYSGSYVKAEDSLRKALERFPRHEGARRLLVATNLRLGQPARALEVLQPLLNQPELGVETLALAGEVYLANNDIPRASDYLERASKLDTSNAAVRARLGQVHFATGDVDRAISDLESASAADQSKYQADILLALNYLRRNQFDKALGATQTLEKKQPNNPITYNIKGAVLLAKRDIKGARESWEKALSLQPNYVPALVNLGRVDLRTKDPAAMRKRFEDVLAKEPNNEQVLLTYAEMLGAAGAERSEIGALVDRAAKGNPSSAVARVAQIEYYRRGGDVKKALSLAQEAIAALPNNAAVLESVGTTQLQAGETNQAISTFNKLVGVLPNSPAPLMRLAGAHVAAKDVDGALQAMRKALAVRPDMTQVHIDIVALLAASGRADQALAESRTVQKQRPKEPLGYVLEGDVYMSQKKLAEAEKAYREAVKVGPANAQAFIKLHGVLEQTKKTTEADALAAKWIKEQPKDVVGRNYLAELEMRMGNLKVASAHYKAVLALQPQNALVLNNLAWMAGQQKDPAAIEYAEKALELAPTNPAVMDTLGMLLVQKGDTARGLELLEKATKAAPQVPVIKLNYAKALAKAGKKDDARRHLEELTKHDNAQVKAEAEAALKTL